MCLTVEVCSRCWTSFPWRQNCLTSLGRRSPTPARTPILVGREQSALRGICASSLLASALACLNILFLIVASYQVLHISNSSAALSTSPTRMAAIEGKKETRKKPETPISCAGFDLCSLALNQSFIDCLVTLNFAEVTNRKVAFCN